MYTQRFQQTDKYLLNGNPKMAQIEVYNPDTLTEGPTYYTILMQEQELPISLGLAQAYNNSTGVLTKRYNRSYYRRL